MSKVLVTNKSDKLKEVRVSDGNFSLESGEKLDLNISEEEARKLSKEEGLEIYIKNRRIND